MADIASYADLIAAVQAVAEDDGTEFTAYIPTAVSLAEERLMRELELPDLEQKVTGTVSALSNSIPKPSNYRFANYIHLLVSGRKTQLKKRREDYLNDYWPDATQTDVPKYYSDSTSSAFVIAPTPDLSYQYEIKYTQAPTRLGPSNTTNYFTEQCSDVLYFATMVEMTIFMKAWSQIPVWEEGYGKLRDTWNIQMARSRVDGGETARNPDASLNTIKHNSQSNA